MELNEITVVIIDDEDDACDTLRHSIEFFLPKLKILGIAKSVASGKNLLQNYSPHIVFLDIQMRDGTGFDLLDYFPNCGFNVIFTTAYDEYAVKAFQYHAIDYLLKPINSNLLIQSVKKVITKNSTFQPSQITSLLKTIKNIDTGKMALNTGDGIVLVKFDELVRLQADANYTNVYLNTNEHIYISKTMGEIELILSDDIFFRTHNSHIININFVRRFYRKNTSYVLMENGDKVPVSRRKKDAFIQTLLNQSK